MFQSPAWLLLLSRLLAAEPESDPCHGAPSAPYAGDAAGLAAQLVDGLLRGSATVQAAGPGALAPLAGLTRVCGDLRVEGATLTDQDLPALREVDGSLFVHNPAAPPDGRLTLPTRLQRVGGDLLVLDAAGSSAGLVELAGAAALEQIGGRLILGGLGDLATITGFGALTRVDRDLELVSLHLLTSLAGFGRLQTIGGDLLIRCAPSLRSLDGLGGLLTIRGGLVLVGMGRHLDATALSPRLALGSLYRPSDLEIAVAPGARPLDERVRVISWFEGPVLGPEVATALQRNAPLQGVETPEMFVAFAASGGGLRTGTFALGVMRGLASLRPGDAAPTTTLTPQGSALGLVDLFSTVSGGGMGVGWALGHEGLIPADAPPRDFRHGRLATLRPVRTTLRSLQSERPPRDGYQRMLGRWYGSAPDGTPFRLKHVWKEKPAPDAWAPLWVPNATDLAGNQALPITPTAMDWLGVTAWWEYGRRREPDCGPMGCDYGELPLELGITASAGAPPLFPGTLLATADDRPIHGADGAFTDRFAANGALQALWEIEQGSYLTGLGPTARRSVLLLTYTRPEPGCWTSPSEHLPSEIRTMERAMDRMRAQDDEERLDYLLGAATDGVRPLLSARSVLPLVQTVNLGPEILVHPDIWASLPGGETCRQAMAELYARVACLPTDLTLPEAQVNDLYDAGTMVAFLQQAALRQSLVIEADPAPLRAGEPGVPLRPMLVPDAYAAACGSLERWTYAGPAYAAWEVEELR